MSVLGLLLLGAADIATPYPTGSILGAFGEVCLQSPRNAQDGWATYETWRREAQAKGWVSIEVPRVHAGGGQSANRDYFAYHRLYALDYDLFVSFLAVDEEMRRAVLRRRVAGRDVYLSLFAASDGGDRALNECRLYDPLGDGISENPVTRVAVQQWLGRPVREARGRYRSTEFWWDHRQSLRVHFGFRGARPSGERGEGFDPYPPYGMTLVRNVSTIPIII